MKVSPMKSNVKNQKQEKPNLINLNTHYKVIKDTIAKDSDLLCKKVSPKRDDQSELKAIKVKTKKFFVGLSSVKNKKNDSDSSVLRPRRIAKRVSSGCSLLPYKRKSRIKRPVDKHVLQVPKYDHYEKRRPSVWTNKAVILSRDYEEDVMRYLLDVESRCMVKNYLLAHPSVSQRTRGMLIDWIIQVQNYLDVSQETLYQSVALIDQVLEACSCCIPIHRVQLLAITALFVISKVEETKPIESSQLLDLTLNSYSPAEMFSMERFVLSLMNFHLTFADPPTFLRYFLHLTCNYSDKMVQDCANFLMEVVLVEVWPLETRPSLLAASALFGALRITHSPLAAMALCTLMPSFFRLEDSAIVATSLRMLEALANRKHSPFQGVNEKYRSKSRYQEVSQHPKLHPEKLLSIIDQVRVTMVSLRDDNIVVVREHSPVKEAETRDTGRENDYTEISNIDPVSSSEEDDNVVEISQTRVNVFGSSEGILGVN